jgi:hypothetical protein
MSGKGGKGTKKPSADGKDPKASTKKKVKKTASGPDVAIANYMEMLSDRGPRPVPKLTFEQKQQFDFVRSMTYNNVW